MTIARWDPPPRVRRIRDHLNYHHTRRGLPLMHEQGPPALERLLEELHQRLPHRKPLGRSHAEAHLDLGIPLVGPVDPRRPRAKPRRLEALR